jgi:hypothetical protein
VTRNESLCVCFDAWSFLTTTLRSIWFQTFSSFIITFFGCYQCHKFLIFILKTSTHSVPFLVIFYFRARACAFGSVVGWGTMLQTGRSRVCVPMRWIFFNWPNPSSRTMALGSTQPLTEMSTRKIPGGVKRGRRIRLTQPYCHLIADCLEDVGASTSHTPMGLHGLLQG